jgi:hypothetical protein
MISETETTIDFTIEQGKAICAILGLDPAMVSEISMSAYTNEVHIKGIDRPLGRRD